MEETCQVQPLYDSHVNFVTVSSSYLCLDLPPDMGLDRRLNVCVDMRVDGRVGMRVQMHVHMRVDMRVRGTAC